MSMADPPPRHLPDRVIRDSLRHPDNLRQFLRHAVPELADGFDCSRARLLDREFPLDDWWHREADLPFEIPYRVGDGERLALVCVLIEHQSDTDALVPLRTLYFAVVYWDKQWRRWEALPRPKPPLRLTPVLPIVLYTDSRPWGSNRTLAELLDEPAAFHAFAPVWQPLFWNLADQTPEELINTGEEWLQTLALIRAQREDAASFEGVLRAAVQRILNLAGRDHTRWYDLIRIVLSWVTHRRHQSEHASLRAAAEQASGAYHQEVRVMAESMAEVLLERGRAEGELKNARAMLRSYLEHRFGTLPEPVLQRVESTTDIDRLRAAFQLALEGKGLDDLQL